MKVVLVGTSNSVMVKGYASALRNSPDIDVVNLSVGASSSLRTCYGLGEAELADADFAVFDYSPNDEVYEAGFGYRDQVVSLWVDLMDRLKAFPKCVPILLVMPRLSFVGKRRPATELHIGYCRAHGIPIFDGYYFLNRLVFCGGDVMQKYFLDEMHMSYLAATALGCSLAERLRELYQRRIPRKSHTETGCRYRFLPAREILPEAESVARASSVMAMPCAVIRGEDRVTVRPGCGLEVVGLGTNARMTRAVIDVDTMIGMTQIVQALSPEPPEGDEKPIFTFVPCRPLRYDAEIGLTLHRHPAMPENAPFSAEITGVIVRDAPSEFEVFVLAHQYIDLAQAVPEREMQMLGTMCRRGMDHA